MLVGGATIIIIFAIVITAAVQGTSGQAFSKIITVGPVWTTDAWSCISTSDFIIHATLRSNGPGNQIAIDISDKGTQSLYTLESGQLETFSIGSPPGAITITRTGPITGFITMQTASNADAKCIPM